MDQGNVAVSKETEVGQKSYLAMMLLASFAGPLGLARIYRGDKALGWGRFWTFVGCILIGMVTPAFPPLAGLVALIQLGLTIWAAVDFFLLYSTKTDASSQPLLRNDLDIKGAKILFVLYIIGLSLAAVAIIFTLIFWSAALSGLMSGSIHTTSFQTY